VRAPEAETLSPGEQACPNTRLPHRVVPNSQRRDRSDRALRCLPGADFGDSMMPGLGAGEIAPGTTRQRNLS